MDVKAPQDGQLLEIKCQAHSDRVFRHRRALSYCAAAIPTEKALITFHLARREGFLLLDGCFDMRLQRSRGMTVLHVTHRSITSCKPSRESASSAALALQQPLLLEVHYNWCLSCCRSRRGSSFSSSSSSSSITTTRNSGSARKSRSCSSSSSSRSRVSFEKILVFFASLILVVLLHF